MEGSENDHVIWDDIGATKEIHSYLIYQQPARMSRASFSLLTSVTHFMQLRPDVQYASRKLRFRSAKLLS